MHGVLLCVELESWGSSTSELGDEPPAAMAVGEEEGDQLLVLLRRPRALLQAHLLAARLPAHLLLLL